MVVLVSCRVDRLNKKYQQLMAAYEDDEPEAMGPLEASIKHLKREIGAAEEECLGLQKQWLDQQTSLVGGGTPPPSGRQARWQAGRQADDPGCLSSAGWLCLWWWSKGEVREPERGAGREGGRAQGQGGDPAAAADALAAGAVGQR